VHPPTCHGKCGTARLGLPDPRRHPGASGRNQPAADCGIDLVSPQPGPSREMARRPLYPAYRRCRGAARTPLAEAAHRTQNLARPAQKRERKAHLGPSLLAPSDLVSGPSEPSLLAQQQLPAPGQQDLDSASESVLARAVSTRGPGFHPCSQGGQTGYKGAMLLIDSHHGSAA
jgi:hypothetical protein